VLITNWKIGNIFIRSNTITCMQVHMCVCVCMYVCVCVCVCVCMYVYIYIYIYMYVQGDRKFTQHIPDTCSIYQKINSIEIRKQKQRRSKVDRNGFCHACFLCHGNGSPDEILSICLAKENREMYPLTHSGKLSKNEMPCSVRQWTLVALVKKISLHFDCLMTTDGLARAGYKMAWPAWALV
jgi:hypothetical protein